MPWHMTPSRMKSTSQGIVGAVFGVQETVLAAGFNGAVPRLFQGQGASPILAQRCRAINSVCLSHVEYCFF